MLHLKAINRLHSAMSDATNFSLIFGKLFDDFFIFILRGMSNRKLRGILCCGRNVRVHFFDGENRYRVEKFRFVIFKQVSVLHHEY